MEKSINETQKYPRNSFILIIPILIILFLFVFSTNIWFQLFLGMILLILFSSLLYVIAAKFEFEMNEFGIFYRIKPFGKKQYIAKSDIASIEIISLDFIGTFGGWGVRKKKGQKAYVFNDGEFLLIKTSKTDYYFSIKDKCKFYAMIEEYYTNFNNS